MMLPGASGSVIGGFIRDRGRQGGAPAVKALGQGLYRAEGLMFHMPGRWELVFELRDGQVPPLRLVQSLQVG